ncbi:sulfotransferase [Ruegeria sp. 6PALISEP08]|uniref:sulfotransferase n=1 Tax=Ruegeria sp. 6PALISEP08 TaxID=1225660 RepID=UPI00067E7DB2
MTEVLPDSAFLTVHYEALIDDFEFEARRIISYCGLEWDSACLDFHKNKRRVRTASVQQVRQPLYKSSKAKWLNYRQQLRPLLDAIGENGWDS